jgi:CO dehydrogenase maturation factor
MKLAVAGKGGSGKTSVSGTMARLLARRGLRVLAIDGDSNPNLALTLGVPSEQWGSVPTLPRDLARRGEDGIELTKSVDEVRASHSLSGPDGTTLLVMAHPDPEEAGKGCLCGMHATVRTLIGELPDTDEDVTILDTEASPEHLRRGTAKYADVLIAVVEPYYKSLETGRRIAALAIELGVERVVLLANKIRDDAELQAVREFAEANDLEVLGVVPYDEGMGAAERARVSPLDHDPDMPFVRAIDDISGQVVPVAAAG